MAWLRRSSTPILVAVTAALVAVGVAAATPTAELASVTNPFAAAVMGWWTGENMLDVAVYINGLPAKDRLRLGDPVGPDDEIYVFQALSGG